jgi:hypothetical protein
VEQAVFINYRHDDAGWAAHVVAAALRRRLGPDRVFLDNSSIALGTAFAHEIESAVRRSGVLLALVGSRWDTTRLHDSADWVRREILLARANGARIVPVLVDGATLPPDPTLPKELRFLAAL